MYLYLDCSMIILSKGVKLLIYMEFTVYFSPVLLPPGKLLQALHGNMYFVK